MTTIEIQIRAQIALHREEQARLEAEAANAHPGVHQQRGAIAALELLLANLPHEDAPETQQENIAVGPPTIEAEPALIAHDDAGPRKG